MTEKSSEETNEAFIKGLIPVLSCVACGQKVRSDGTAKGRLRLVCVSCKRSFYGDSHPIIQKALKERDFPPIQVLSRQPNSTPANGLVQILPSQISSSYMPTSSTSQNVSYTNYGSTSLHGSYMHSGSTSPRNTYVSETSSDDDNSSGYYSTSTVSHNPIVGSNVNQHPTRTNSTYPTLHETEQVDQDMPMAHEFAELHQEMFLDIENDIYEMKEKLQQNEKLSLEIKNQTFLEISNMQKTMSILVSKIEQLSSALLAPQYSVPLTNKNSHLIYRNEPNDVVQAIQEGSTQHHTTLVSATSHDTTSEDNRPWLTAARRGKASPTPQVQVLNSANRFRDLSESIPAYQNFDTEEEYDAHIAKTRAPKKIRQLTPEELKRVIDGRPARGSSPMIRLYFEGMRRNKFTEIKSALHTMGLQLRHIRNISFIGSCIMEITTFMDVKQNIIDTLSKYNITNLENFNPLSIENLKDDKKFSGLKTVAEKENAAKKLFTTRMLKTVERLPKTHINNRLRNYYISIINSLTTNAQVDESGVAQAPNTNVTLKTSTQDISTQEGSTQEVSTQDLNTAIDSISSNSTSSTSTDVEPTPAYDFLDDDFLDTMEVVHLSKEKRRRDSESDLEDAKDINDPENEL